MSNEQGSSAARSAVDALLHLNQYGRDLCPPGSDPRAWASSVLYDLARVAELLDGAVERVSGKRNATVSEEAHALATVISAHRNLEVGPPAE